MVAVELALVVGVRIRGYQTVRVFFPDLELMTLHARGIDRAVLLVEYRQELWVRGVRRRLPVMVVELRRGLASISLAEGIAVPGRLLRLSSIDVRSALGRLQSRKHFGKACSVSRDSVCVLPVWHLLVRTELCLEPLQVDQGFITGSACVGTYVPLGQHAVVAGASLLAKHFEQVSYFPTQLVQLARSVVLGGACVLHQLCLVGQLLLQERLQLL